MTSEAASSLQGAVKGGLIRNLYPHDFHCLTSCTNIFPLDNSKLREAAQDHFQHKLDDDAEFASAFWAGKDQVRASVQPILDSLRQMAQMAAAPQGVNADIRIWQPIKKTIPLPARQLQEGNWEDVMFHEITKLSDRKYWLESPLRSALKDLRKRLQAQQQQQQPSGTGGGSPMPSRQASPIPAQKQPQKQQQQQHSQNRVSPTSVTGSDRFVAPPPLAPAAPVSPTPPPATLAPMAVVETQSNVALGRAGRMNREENNLSQQLMRQQEHEQLMAETDNALLQSFAFASGSSWRPNDEDAFQTFLETITVGSVARGFSMEDCDMEENYEHFLERVESEEYKACLDYIYIDLGNQDPEEWARQLYLTLRDDHTDKRASTLNLYRKFCLRLLFDMVDAWETSDDAAFKDFVINQFGLNRLLRIVYVGLLMDRSQSLHCMRIDTSSYYGMHWYSKYHQQHDASWNVVLAGYQGRTTFNKRLFKIIDTDCFGLLTVDDIRKWSRPARTCFVQLASPNPPLAVKSVVKYNEVLQQNQELQQALREKEKEMEEQGMEIERLRRLLQQAGMTDF